MSGTRPGRSNIFNPRTALFALLAGAAISTQIPSCSPEGFSAVLSSLSQENSSRVAPLFESTEMRVNRQTRHIPSLER